MYKNSVLAEVLYCMSLRLKGGGVKAKKIWTKKHIKWLESILDVIDVSSALLKADRDITGDDILPIIEFVNNNSERLFGGTKIEIGTFCDENGEMILHNNNDWDSLDDKIVSCMQRITAECRGLLKNKSKGYKDRVQQLLTAFHNLPRTYLSRVYDPDIKSTLLGRDYSRTAISKAEAAEYCLRADNITHSEVKPK